MKRADIIRAIGSQHIEEAIKCIDLHGVPRRRNSTKFSLPHEGRLYPPKYLIAVAFHQATGQTLTTQDHSGGEQDSNKILHELGFPDVVPQPSDRPEY
jgi:5-methylcytosine-specific restriction enzyme B